MLEESDPAHALFDSDRRRTADLLSHMQQGYQLETDSLGGNPVLRRLKDDEEMRPLSATSKASHASPNWHIA
jgi:hypothetical protein